MNRKALGYKGHMIISVFIALLFVRWESPFILLPVTLLYGLIPDIDTVRSRIGRLFLVVSLAAIGLAIIFRHYILAIIFLLVVLVLVLSKHRGFTHKFYSAFLFSAPLLMTNENIFLAGLLSYLGHLLTDRL
ncbi:MAG: metal-dependent hydrolase [Nanobdellota archaeon]